MSMIYALRQASDETIACLLNDPKSIYPYLGHPDPEMRQKPSLFGRLFGRSSRTPEPTSRPAYPWQNLPGDECSLEKSWHGLHFLLTGTEWEGQLPAAFLLNGGTEIGSHDVGYGPARAFTSDETAGVAAHLSGLDRTQLAARYDPARMDEMKLYPNTPPNSWNDEGELDDLLNYFDELKEFVRKAADQRLGLVVYLG
jgi:hypothetical protein